MRNKAATAWKFLQGLAVACVVAGPPLAFNPPALLSSKTLVLVAVSALASMFQPSYNPFSGAPDAKDRGTASQIIWSIYCTQAAVLVEAGCFRWPESFAWDLVSVAGLALMAAGLALRTWAVFTLGEHFTWHISSSEGQPVVERGPYMWVRHPGYLGAFMTYSATAVFLHAWAAMIPAAAVLWLAFERRMRLEEDELLRRVGPAYEEYRSRTARFIPGVW